MLTTEYPFTLPKGFVDEEGNLHRNGVMRLATAADEILPLKDPRVENNSAYLLLILLSRVVIKLGTLKVITPLTIENLFIEDLTFLQDFYNEINGSQSDKEETICPKCNHIIVKESLVLGELLATP